MIIFLVLIILTGFGSLLMISKKELKLSYIFSYSLILGLGFHSLLFIICSIINLYYSIPLTIIISLLSLIIGIIISRKNNTKIINDVKIIPIIYLGILGIVVFRFIQFTSTGFANSFNWDELKVYQLVSKQTFLTHNMRYIFSFFSPMLYFVGNGAYSFGGLALTTPRLLNGILFANVSLIIYFQLTENNINKRSAALLAILYLISSTENLYNYRGFSSNIYYSLFFVSGIYLTCKDLFIDKKNNISLLAYIILCMSILTRREGIYEVVAFLILTLGYLIYKKRISIKNSLKYFLVPLVFQIVYTISTKLLLIKEPFSELEQTTGSGLHNNLSISNILSYSKEAIKQLVLPGRFSSNYIATGMCILVVGFVIYSLIKKIKNKNMEFFSFVIIAELIYLGIVLATQAFLMSEREFKIAASLSRYLLSLSPINFVLFGMAFIEKNKN